MRAFTYHQLTIFKVFRKHQILKTLIAFGWMVGLASACVAPTVTPRPSLVAKPTSTVTPTTSTLPDLSISSITLNTDPEDRCDPLSGNETIQILLVNLGQIASPPFSIQINGKTQTVEEGLLPKGVLTVQLKGYTSQITAIVDSKNQVKESDEENNTYRQVFPLPTTHPTCLLQPTPVIPTLLPSAVLEGHDERVLSVAFSPDGALLASGSVDNTLRLWQVSQATLLRTMRGHPFPILSVQFYPNGTTLATSSVDGIIRLWQVSNSRLLQVLSGHAGWVPKLAISPNGRTLASCGQDFTVRLWRTTDGYPIETIDEGMASITDLAFSPDNQSLAWAESDGTVRLRSLNGKWLQIFRHDSLGASSVAFSPDGAWLAAGYADGIIRIWDIAGGSLLQTLSGHSDRVASLVCSSDGRYLISGSHDKSIILWRLTRDFVEEQPALILVGHSGPVNSVAISPRDNLIATGANDKTIRLWPLPEQE